ncbi:MAG: hypothetical protein NC434_02700 [Ruminococcus sp.]|nr:hypothetical protein [Ruminococcus sp.]
MYDFILGDKETIIKNTEEEKKFLLSVKRMLPRWCNSIPDSEFLAIYDVLFNMGGVMGLYMLRLGLAQVLLYCFGLP